MNTFFIVIDDDAFNNMLCGHFIANTLTDATVQTFLDPLEGLRFIEHLDREAKAVVLIDINMPELNGWDVLERITAMTPAVRERLEIYMFSSSVDKRDKDRAIQFPMVRDYIEKPLDPTKLLTAMAKSNASGH